MTADGEECFMTVEIPKDVCEVCNEVVARSFGKMSIGMFPAWCL